MLLLFPGRGEISNENVSCTMAYMYQTYQIIILLANKQLLIEGVKEWHNVLRPAKFLSMQGKDLLNKALTRSTANAVFNTFKHLCGLPYYTEGIQRGIIEQVAISPYDDINKWLFLQNYIETRCAVDALRFYEVPFFNIVLIIAPDNNTPLFLKDLESYLTSLNLPLPELITTPKN